MRKKQHIKVFSHSDLDGFGAPLLLQAMQPYLFENVDFDLVTCHAGGLDTQLEYFFKEPELNRYTDVYIMDMTPDSDYSFKQLEARFANHWIIFDHHDTEQALRDKYSDNCVVAKNPTINPSATSLVWDWASQKVNFANIPTNRQKELGYIVELIRAYDTWDWKNDPNLPINECNAADELNQLFWFFPLRQSETFVRSVYEAGWQNYREKNTLLVNTLNGRRQRYLDKHLKSIKQFEFDGNKFGVVYASDYKSEIAHELLKREPLDAVLVIDAHSVSLRSNGRIDVASFSEKYFGGGGHADSAGGTLPINPVEIGEQAVIDSLLQNIKLKNDLAKKQDDNQTGGLLADNINPEIAAKLASLFE